MENIILWNIIEKLPCHVYWLNRENVYLGFNEQQAKDFGLKSKNEVKGKTNFDFHEHNTAVKLNKINELVMSTGRSYEGEEQDHNPGVKVTNTLTTKIPIFDIHGKVVGIIGVSFDITNRKRAAELKKKVAVEKELYEMAREVALTYVHQFKHYMRNG